MHVDVASRAPHGRKHGATFVESWTTHDHTTVVVIGAVLAGADPIAVGDLLHAGSRALVNSRGALQPALIALDKLVSAHAREHRDDALAAAVALLAFPRDGAHVDVAGAGQLHVAILNGSGDRQPLHAHAGALGTGIEPHDVVASYPFHHDGLVVAATVPIPEGWWPSGDRTANGLLQRTDAGECSAAVVSFV